MLFTGNCTDSFEKDKRLIDFKNSYLSLVREFDYIDKTLFQVFTDIDAFLALKQKKKYLIEYVNDIISFSEDTIDRIEKRLSDYSNVYSLHYQSCLIIDVLPFSSSKCQLTFMEVWSRLEDNDDKTKINIFFFGKTFDGFERYGVFYDVSYKTHTGKENLLLNMYRDICKLLSVRSYKYRTILIPLLPDCATFKHDLRKNISIQTNALYNNLLKHIECHFVNDVFTQMILVCTRDTNESYVDLVKEIKWDSYDEKEAVTIRGFTKYQITIQKFYMDKPFSITAPKNQLSTVALFQKKELIGTGFLIQYNGEIYCLSCQHLFEKTDGNIITACVTGDKRIFELKILNKKSNPDDKPKDEIAILSPIWDKGIWMNLSNVFTEKDLIVETDNQPQYCKCFGYHNAEGDWLDGIVPIGLNADQYYYMQTEKNYNLHGFSGSAIVSSDGKLFGIHKRHEGKLIFVIHGSIISEVLEELTKQKEMEW